MRRSLRKIDSQEVRQYDEAEQLFTVESLDEARKRLTDQGLDPARYCFYTWMRGGVRYYRVWEDKRLKAGIVPPAPFGQTAARLKRADAEKLYTVAKRYSGDKVQFALSDGLLRVIDPATGKEKVGISLPVVGGGLIFHQAEWNERQAAHFVNAILVRGQRPDTAYEEAEALEGVPSRQ
ncbi:hypothetical protein J2Z79_003423 [Symbiobacterium terraclitae]|uniref:Uncharacterized protein n=1 Tax=Symbiobacterium terraclitae TaxID=557451 RepID=A0ABS4JWV0_9FIRM|nr:hypothetical protein [Symbiobacterium terraclitae]MBP2019976.1 hypothetical protein [Symbiobacterium terraclitae]